MYVCCTNNIRDKYQNVIEMAKIGKQNGSILNPNQKTLGKREKKGKKNKKLFKIKRSSQIIQFKVILLVIVMNICHLVHQLIH